MSKNPSLSLLLLSLAAGTASATKVGEVVTTGTSAVPGSSAAGSVVGSRSVSGSVPGVGGLTNSGVSMGNVQTFKGPNTVNATGLTVNGTPQVNPSVQAAGIGSTGQKIQPRAATTNADPARVAVDAAQDPAKSAAAAAAPDAGKTLTKATGDLGKALKSDGAGVVGGIATERVMNRLFDAAVARAAMKDGVQGSVATVDSEIRRRMNLPRQFPESDGPTLYADAIKIAEEKLSPASAAEYAKLIRGVAETRLRADDFRVLNQMAERAFAWATDHPAKATLPSVGTSEGDKPTPLNEFSRYEALLKKPLFANEPALREAFHASARSGASRPHVFFSAFGKLIRAENLNVAAIRPGATAATATAATSKPEVTRVAEMKFPGPAALAASIDQAAEAPGTYPESRGVWAESVFIYKFLRRAGDSRPVAFAEAARYAARQSTKSLVAAVSSFFWKTKPYAVADAAGASELKAEAALSASIAAKAAQAEAALRGERLTVAGVRASLAALADAAADMQKLDGDRDAVPAADSLVQGFDHMAAGSSELTDAGLKMFAHSDGGPLYWARRLTDAAAARVEGRLWSASFSDQNLATPGSPAALAADSFKKAGDAVSVISTDGRVWAKARGAFGEARLTFVPGANASGGSLRLTVARPDAALKSRLAGIGVLPDATSEGLVVSIGRDDEARDAAAMADEAALVLSAALGADLSPKIDAAVAALLRDLESPAARDEAKKVGATAGASVIGAFGEYPVVALAGRVVMLDAAFRPVAAVSIGR